MDAIFLALTGQEWLVVKHQIFALVANLMSWAMVTLGLRSTRMRLVPLADGPRDRAVSIASPGGYERFTFVPLGQQDGNTLATTGYNVVEGVERVAGQPSVVRLAGGAIPDECILVRVQAFSINYADVTIRWGLYESAIRHVGYPIVPGFDFVGVVERAGAASGFRAGDEVHGVTFFGAYSSRLLVPGKQARKRPGKLSIAEAAAVPSVAGTALHALALAGFWPKAPITTNKAVLVHSAAGGVGSMLVQMARALGADPVVAVVGAAHKVAACRALGAHVVIDKSSEDLWEAAARAASGGFAAVFDANGVATLAASYRALAQSGHLVVYGFHTNLPSSDLINPFAWARMAAKLLRMPRFDPPDMVLAGRSVHGFNLSFFSQEDALIKAYMEQIDTWLAEARIRAPAVTPFKMDEVPRAHQVIQSGQSVGKLVIVTD